MASLAPPLAAEVAVRSIHRLLDEVDAGVPGRRPVSTVLVEVDRAIRRLQSIRLRLVSQAERSGVHQESGAADTVAWLAAASRSDGAQAARDVRLATALDGDLGVTRRALDAGTVSPELAGVIAEARSRLPSSLRPAEVAAIEESLVAQAQVVDPRRLRRLARRSPATVEPDPAVVDAHEDEVLRADEDAAYAKTRLTWHHHDDGTTSGQFTLPRLAADMLIKSVQQIASPRRFAQRAAREARAAGVTGAVGLRRAQWEAFAGADGDWAHRYGTAFLELVEHLPTDRLHGKVAATVLVTVDHERLAAGLGAGRTDTGVDLSAREARRLSCGAGLLPVVLRGESLPLDLGRTARFFTEHQRVALATRYDTCAADDCDRPFAWAELHHEDAWSTGGVTDLGKAVPLCGVHHRRIHDPGYAHRIRTSPQGAKTVTFVRRT